MNYSIFSLARAQGAFEGPVAGYIMDRFGPRPLILTAIMMKAPRPGQVKTRLAAAGIGEPRVLRQFEQFEVRHCAQQLAHTGQRGADAEMLVAQETQPRGIARAAALLREEVRGQWAVVTATKPE